MGLFKNLVGKAADLMTEDTVYSASGRRDGSSDEILAEASDEMFLEYVSAFVRLIKKGKKPYGDFYNAIERDIYSRPEKSKGNFKFCIEIDFVFI